MTRARVKHIVHRRWQIVKPGTVKVGFPRGSDQDILNRAFWNEYGTDRIPSRPFMRNSLRRNLKKYQRFIKTKLSGITLLRIQQTQVLRQLGLLAQGYIQTEIRILNRPPNAPATIRRKGSSNPLIDTGEMRQAVTYEIV